MKTTKRRLKPSHSSPEIRSSEDRLFKYFVSYALLLLFVLASIFSTSDLQLLQTQQQIALPLVNTNTSISGFFFVSTMITCAASIFMAREFHSLEALKKNANQGSGSLFTYLNHTDQSKPLLGIDGKLDCIVLNIISCLVFFVSGPLVTALLLFRFADSQDRLIFCAQLALFILATYFSWVFYQRTVRLNANRKTKILAVIVGIAALTITVKLIICLDVIYLPPQYSPTFFLKLHTNLLDDEDNGTISVVPHLKIDRTESIWKIDTNRQHDDIAFQNGSNDPNHYFMSRALSIDLRGRRLRFLDIPFQIAPRIWAHEADLSGANLSFAKLAGSNFVGTSLYATNMTMATLDGSNFFSVNLDQSIWSHARVRGALFDTSHLDFADLRNTKFLGSVFLNTRISHSNIKYADFSAASFSESTLKDNALSLKTKAHVFDSGSQDQSRIEGHLELFDANDDEAISDLVGEFCIEKLKAADLIALHKIANTYVLLFPTRASQVSNAFRKPSCNAAKSAWSVATGQ